MTKSYGVGKIGPLSKIQDWIKARKNSGHGEFPFLRVAPEDNVLLGIDRICGYLGIRSHVTMYKWIELHGLPVVRRPDGWYMTTMTAIDQWLFLVSEVENENRPWSRGTNARLELARKRLDNSIALATKRREAQEQNGGIMDSGTGQSETEKV